MSKIPAKVALAKDAIIKVGDGRGFVVEAHTRRERFVITAAHCLPHLPPAHAASYAEDRTYAKLLGPIGESPTVWAECVFVDPVADIAVLSAPDGQALFDECADYERLVDGRPALRV